MQPFTALLPLGVSLVAGSGALFAQSLDGSAADPTGAVFSGSILAASVGALVWITKQFVGGKLVARDPDIVEDKLITIVAELVKVTEKSHEREREYLQLLRTARVAPVDPEQRP